MKYLKTFNESIEEPQFYKVPFGEKTLFEPSFKAKLGETNFYQLRIGGKPVTELEINPNSKRGYPEIMSLFSDIKGQGLGQILTNAVLDIYLKDKVYVLTTKSSRPFWLRCGAIPVVGEDPFLLQFVK